MFFDDLDEVFDAEEKAQEEGKVSEKPKVEEKKADAPEKSSGGGGGGFFGFGDDDEVVQAKPKQGKRRGLVASAMYFEDAACQNVYWYNPDEKGWYKRSAQDNTWAGYSGSSASKAADLADWTPFSRVLNDDNEPFYKWFVDGQINAAFNEVDVHIIEGYGKELAYIEEADPAVRGDVTAELTRIDLFKNSAAASQKLSDLGLKTGDRVLFDLPAGFDQITWVSACMRLGIIYCCCNPGLPAEQIADRVYTLRAKLVITTEHPDWSFTVHKAVNNFVPVDDVVAHAKANGIDSAPIVSKYASRFTVNVQELVKDHGQQFASLKKGVLLDAQVLELTSLKVPVNAVQAKVQKPPIEARTHRFAVAKENFSEDGPTCVKEVWAKYGAPVPVEANTPLFIIFTSGTTGKPKGVAHVHSYIVGLVETMKVSFNAKPGEDRMLTIGALGWITGQSYQINAVLAARITAVLMRGNPTRPSRARFAEVINKHKVTIFKAGSAFLRDVMSVPEAGKALLKENSVKQLKVATFCAEPVSEAVHEYAMDKVCKNYINSYWATEHGGIVWSRMWGNDGAQPLKPNAHSWPMPWVDADVLQYDESTKNTGEDGKYWEASASKYNERGEVVVTCPYPYQFRYVWGDVENYGKQNWVGDKTIMLSKYWRNTKLPGKDPVWMYVQGDYAQKYQDGSYTFHGRSDEVLNVNGILFGTEHIEGAILRERVVNPDSPIGQCVVVGYPDKIQGEVPLAFVVPGVAGTAISSDDTMRCFQLVRQIVGDVNVKFVTVSGIPQTFSGKFMRRTLKCMAAGEPLGDISTMVNPDIMPVIEKEFKVWQAEDKKLFGE